MLSVIFIIEIVNATVLAHAILIMVYQTYLAIVSNAVVLARQKLWALLRYLGSLEAHKVCQHRQSWKERIWLWSSAWFMGLVGLYGFGYGAALGAFIDASILGAMLGAILSSIVVGLLINGIYQTLSVILHPGSTISRLWLFSMMQGLVITLSLAGGVLLAGSVGLTIACISHFVIVLTNDCCQHRQADRILKIQ